jgi:creatinine amidohydrolase/Fe(II)-dependent formamide hydrolase-like protein
MRRDLFPIVYLPMGLCEPHGHIAALGLDLLKAEYYCEQAADRFGVVVAPAQGYTSTNVASMPRGSPRSWVRKTHCLPLSRPT